MTVALLQGLSSVFTLRRRMYYGKRGMYRMKVCHLVDLLMVWSG